MISVKHKAYTEPGRVVARSLRDVMTPDELRDLHRLSPTRHFLLVGRHVALTVAAAIVLWKVSNPWIWIPVALLQGFNILGFIILVHEWVHDAIFDSPHPRAMRILGLLYAFPSAISATQFRRWHLDHHDELGSATDDPKRAHLTPKIVTRWYKALYFTPALFVIYSIASAREAKACYAPDLQRTIARERNVNMLLHLGIMAVLWIGAGASVMLRVWFVPLFLAFPIAFTLNRLGQHYDIDPANPLAWSTLVKSQPVWNFLFLYSNFHLEHHYYPRVPFYRLESLQRRLWPMYEKEGIRPKGFGRILWGWFVENRTPHTKWAIEETRAVAAAGGSGAAEI